MPAPGAIESLDEVRVAEREQAAFYRALAAEAEARGDVATAERLNELHADEQHQLSRLTARLVELGGAPRPLPSGAMGAISLDGWEDEAVEREAAEAERYEGLLEYDWDEDTTALLEEILRVERLHGQNLGGKWMGA